MGPKPVHRALETCGSRVRCLAHYPIAQTGGRLEELFTGNFTDWLSCEHGTLWRSSCPWLELHLRFPHARARRSGARQAAGGAEQPGACCPAMLLQGLDDHRLAPLVWPHNRRGKSARLGTESVQTHSCDTRWLRLPTWLGQRWCSGSELAPLCPVTVLVRKQPESNWEFPKSEGWGGEGEYQEARSS